MERAKLNICLLRDASMCIHYFEIVLFAPQTYANDVYLWYVRVPTVYTVSQFQDNVLCRKEFRLSENVHITYIIILIRTISKYGVKVSV